LYLENPKTEFEKFIQHCKEWWINHRQECLQVNAGLQHLLTYVHWLLDKFQNKLKYHIFTLDRICEKHRIAKWIMAMFTRVWGDRGYSRKVI
jgi:hypothetical protein